MPRTPQRFFLLIDVVVFLCVCVCRESVVWVITAKRTLISSGDASCSSSGLGFGQLQMIGLVCYMAGRRRRRQKQSRIHKHSRVQSTRHCIAQQSTAPQLYTHYIVVLPTGMDTSSSNNNYLAFRSFSLSFLWFFSLEVGCPPELKSFNQFLFLLL